MKYIPLFIIFSIIFSMSPIVSGQIDYAVKQKENISFPELYVFDNEFHTYFTDKNKIEEIVSGKIFLEGPLWVDALDGLLFSDIGANRIYHWNESKGLSVWLEPSGFANGLLLDHQGNLLLMQGNYASTTETKRQIGKIVNPVSNKEITDFITNYDGKKFNSPNDIIQSSNGIIYFTDPPYGLKNGDEDPLKELPFNGLYRYKKNELKLLIDSIQRPNGIALSPNDKYLYVADTEVGRLLTYKLDKSGDIKHSVDFFDIKGIVGRRAVSSMPFFDGMTVSNKGVIILTGYNGVWFVSPKGTLMAHIQTPEFTSNCTLDPREEYLYWTSGKYPYVDGASSLHRLKIKL